MSSKRREIYIPKFKASNDIGLHNAVRFLTSQFPQNQRPRLPKMRYVGDREGRAFYIDEEQEEIFEDNKQYVTTLIGSLTMHQYPLLKSTYRLLTNQTS